MSETGRRTRRAPASGTRRLSGARRGPRWLLGLLAMLVLVGMLAEPVRLRAVAATTVADALDLPVVRLVAAEVSRERTRLDGVEGDRYDVGPDAQAVVLIPGAAPRGIEDPRIVQLAEAIARAGRTVFVPQLEVYEETLVTTDVDRLVAATLALSDEQRGPAVLVGTSFGGSLGMLAAADERLDGRVALVASFGAYADLLGVLQAVTTGHSLVGDRLIAWEDPHPDAEQIVRDQLADLLEPADRRQLRRLLDDRLAVADADGPARAAHALLVNDDPTRTDALARRLPAEVRQRLAEVSPVSVADDLDVPVVAMHSVQDPAIPFGELRRLEEAIPHARIITLERFDHVELDLQGPRDVLEALGDLRRTWRFATHVLAAESAG